MGRKLLATPTVCRISNVVALAITLLLWTALAGQVAGKVRRVGDCVELSYGSAATIDSFLDDIGSTLNIGIVVDSPQVVRLKRIPTCQLKPAELLPFAQLVLRTHGLTLIEIPSLQRPEFPWYRVADVRRVGPFNTPLEIRELPSPVRLPSPGLGISSRIIRLQHQRASEIGPAIAQLIGESIVDSSRRTLPPSISASAPSDSERPEASAPVNQGTQILAGAQQRMMRLNTQSISSASRAATSDRKPTESVIAIHHLNWLVVTGYDDQLERAGQLIARMDVPKLPPAVRELPPRSATGFSQLATGPLSDGGEAGEADSSRAGQGD